MDAFIGLLFVVSYLGFFYCMLTPFIRHDIR